jgi:hypothetical protein
MRRVVATCESMKLEYFITGSVASMFYGEPRLTADIDVVVVMPSWSVKDFCAAFPEPDFYVNAEAARESISQGGPFNIIHIAAGAKADIIAMKGEPFEESCLSRARRIQLLPDLSAMVISAEDIILSKLLFYQEGGSDKHLRDIASIFRISGPSLDRRYLDDWSLRVRVNKEWRMVLQRATSSSSPGGAPGGPLA